jgi:long-chain acyl-CoA synthetase
MADPGIPATMCEAFQATATRYPQEVALRTVGGAVTITWEAYASQVRQIAAGLAALGVGRGDTVALMMTNRPEFHLVDTAAFHLGAIPFSVYNTFAAEQIAQVLGNAANRVVVCEDQFARQLLEVTGGTAVEHVVCVDGRPDGSVTLEEMVAGGDPGFGFEARWQAVQPDDVLTLIYTSGTTGPPKGVEITHAQMLAETEATEALMPGRADDRLVSYLPMAHIAERGVCHYRAMLSGAQVTSLADAKALPGALADVRPTILFGVPRVWEKLKAGIDTLVTYEPDQTRRQAVQEAFKVAHEHVDAAQAGQVPAGLAEAGRRADEQVLSKIRQLLGLDQLRLAISGAAPIAPDILRYMFALGIPVLEVWGMSECCGAGTANPPEAIRIGTVGPALPGVQLKLADDGELLLHGPIVMKGYRNDPARTAEAIDSDGWLHSGDLAAIDEDGYVRITGRKKELIINSAGKNMSPAAIEGAVLAASLMIAQVVAVGDRRPYVVALIVLDPEAAAAFGAQQGITDPSPAVLADHPAIRGAIGAAVDAANAKLARVEQIKRFAILPASWEPGGDEITPTMKLKRHAVTDKYADVIESLYAESADREARKLPVRAKGRVADLAETHPVVRAVGGMARDAGGSLPARHDRRPVRRRRHLPAVVRMLFLPRHFPAGRPDVAVSARRRPGHLAARPPARRLPRQLRVPGHRLRPGRHLHAVPNGPARRVAGRSLVLGVRCAHARRGRRQQVRHGRGRAFRRRAVCDRPRRRPRRADWSRRGGQGVAGHAAGRDGSRPVAPQPGRGGGRARRGLHRLPRPDGELPRAPGRPGRGDRIGHGDSVHDLAASRLAGDGGIPVRRVPARRLARGVRAGRVPPRPGPGHGGGARLAGAHRIRPLQVATGVRDRRTAGRDTAVPGGQPGAQPAVPAVGQRPRRGVPGHRADDTTAGRARQSGRHRAHAAGLPRRMARPGLRIRRGHRRPGGTQHAPDPGRRPVLLADHQRDSPFDAG